MDYISLHFFVSLEVLHFSIEQAKVNLCGLENQTDFIFHIAVLIDLRTNGCIWCY